MAYGVELKKVIQPSQSSKTLQLALQVSSSAMVAKFGFYLEGRCCKVDYSILVLGGRGGLVKSLGYCIVRGTKIFSIVLFFLSK